MGLVSLARSLRSALASFDAELHSGDDCAALVEELARTEKACAAARAVAAVRAAGCGAHRSKGLVDAVDWLARVGGVSAGEAERELSTAKRLAELPDTLALAVRGDLSLDQAEEIARTERACPGSEAEMLVLAQRDGLRSLRDRGRDLRLRSITAEELARRQHQARSLRHWRDELGMVRGSFALEPHVGIPLVNRLDAMADRLRRAMPGAERLATPFECSAADALAQMTAGGGGGRATRAEVVFVADLDTAKSHIVGGGPVPEVRVLEAIDRSAFVKGVVHDGVAVTHVRHYGKALPAALRSAIEIGRPPGFDGMRCGVAGCDRRLHLEKDHLDPRANGGVWSLDNVEPKCWYHHVEKTERDRKAGLLAGGARGP